MSTDAHLPVLLEEVMRWLRPELGGVLVDCTTGMGGHSKAMLQASDSTTVIGIDRDAESLEVASNRLEQYGERFKPVHANYKDIDEILDRISYPKVRGIVADLGISSYQLSQAERGFSFTQDAPLDMRMDRSSDVTAADIVNNSTETELADIIYAFGEERGARKIARAIVKERQKEPILTTSRLAELVVRALRTPGRWRIHPATRTFQALRIAVNEELAGLAEFISAAISHLLPGGRLAIISFHSLEDRIVKSTFRLEAGQCQCASGPNSVQGGGYTSNLLNPAIDDLVCQICGARKRVSILTRKPVRPSEAEIARNPRSRSALLRVAERLGQLDPSSSPI